MNKKKIIISICIIALIILVIGLFFIIKNWNNQKEQSKESNNNQEESFEEFKNNSIMYDEQANLDELKEEYKITGPDEIYEIQTEYDGRKAVVVKPEINYKVAFAEIIKKSVPELSEIDSCFEKNYPKEDGIWIDENSQERIINYLNNTELLNNEYSINDDGFLQINKNENGTEMDKDIEEAINSDKLNVISISGTCYMVDPITGDIVRNPYEDLNSTQTYEYFEYEDDKIIFVTENINKELTEDEIFESIIKLINNM